MIAPPTSAHLQIEVERIHGVRKDQRLADMDQRGLNKIDEPVVK